MDDMANVINREVSLAPTLTEGPPPILTVGRFLTVATRFDDGGAARWINGVRFRPWPRLDNVPVVAEPETECVDDTASAVDLDLPGGACYRDEFLFCPDRFEATATVSNLVEEDREANLAIEQLEQFTSWNLAQLLELGAADSGGEGECDAGLADKQGSSADVTADTGVALAKALAALEQSIVSDAFTPDPVGSGNRRHTIVMTVQAQDFLASRYVIEYNADLDAYVTASGHVVMADAGFQGIIGSAASATVTPIYLVPQVLYQVTAPKALKRAVLQPSYMAGSGSAIEHNQTTHLAQQFGIVVYDQTAVRVAYGTYTD